MGIFNDIEESENGEIIRHNLVIGALIRTVKDALQVRGLEEPPYVAYRGKLDGRIPRPYPGPAKRGNFWIGEYEGHIGSSVIVPGDCLVRVSTLETDWVLIPAYEISLRLASRLSSKEVKFNSVLKPGKTFNEIKQDLTDAHERGFTGKKFPATKSAPGAHKRKIILEDD